MSVIAGMYNFQEPVVRSQELAHLAAALRERTLDRIDQATSGGIGMLVAVLLTVAEEYPVPQPLTCPNGLMLAWDGRLDNRDTLLHSLGSLHQPSADAQLVLGTYERRGPCFAAELLGDFAFALWDPSARRLLLGRDLAGTRPLFYYATSEKLVWASDIRVLLSMPEVSADIDDEFVAGYLSREAEPWRTPYRAIRALPAGHVLTARVGGIEVTRFWQPDPYRQIRYATDVEYEEHFRSLFREAVRVRLRAKGTVCAELSGGLDSSAIVCVADGLIKRGEVAATNLSTISFVYDSSPTSDEREFIAEVDRLRGVQGFHLREEDNRILSKLDFPDGFDMPTGRRVFAGFYDQLSEAMEQVGASVLLSGTAGDQVMWGEVAAPFDLADFLKQLRLGMFLRNLHAWSIDQRRPLFQLVWQAAVWPLLPRAMRTNGGPYHQVPQWLHPRFVASTNVKDRMLGPSEVEQYGFRLPSRREQFATIQEVINGLSCWYWGNYPTRRPVEVTYPFLHRPLLEFAMAIPVEQKLRPGETRSLLRRSMKGVLPEKIRTRKVKRGPEEALYKALSREWPQLQRLLADARICERGYVEPTKFREMFEGLRYGRRADGALIIRALSLEFWLRSREAWDATRSLTLAPTT